MRVLWTGIAVFCMFSWCMETWGLPVDIDAGQFVVSAEDDLPNDPPESAVFDFVDAAFGISGSLSATDGSAKSTTKYETLNSPTEAAIDLDVEQMEFGPVGHFASSNGFVAFSLADDASYAFSGQLVGAGSDVGDVYWLQAILFRLDDLSNIYLETEIGRGLSVSFALNGAAEGGILPALGSQSGVLQPGAYQLQYLFRVLDEDQNGEGSSNATGHLRFELRAIPEPSASLLAAIAGLSGISGRRRSVGS